MSEEKMLKEKVILEINFDQDAEHPSEWLDWEIFSFSRSHGNFKDPDNYANRLSRINSPVSKPSWSKKLNANTGFWLDCFQHSCIIWNLHGEGMQCQWDTAPWNGVLVGDYKNLKKLDHGQREESARFALEIYNSYFNGSVYDWSFKLNDLQYLEDSHRDNYYDEKTLIRDVIDDLKMNNLELIALSGDASDLFSLEEITETIKRRNNAC